MTATNAQPTPIWRRIAGWLTHTRAEDTEQARRGRLAAALILVIGLAAAAGLAVGAASAPDALSSPAFLAGLGLAILWAAVYAINRRGWLALAGIGMALVLLAANLMLIALAGPLAPAATTLALPVIVAGLFGPPLAALLVAAAAGLGYLGLNVRADAGYFAALAAGGPALQTLLVYANLAIVGPVAWLFARTTRRVIEESRELGLALVEQRAELVARLEGQTRQLQATIAVAHAIAGERDLNHLLEDAVRLLRETFGYYHVQVFLVDADQHYAVLRQSTGEAGRKMLESGHRLPVGSLSVIGQVTASGRPVIVRDADADPVHRHHELLPDTRSEMALPLSVGGRVIGALDLQSAEPDAFDQAVIPTLRALADQLAVAIENARLFEQAQASLREMRELSREAAHRSWAEFLAETRDEERSQSYGPEPPALRAQRSRVIERVLGSGSVIISTGQDGAPAYLAVPLVMRNEVVGVLGVEPDGSREWTRDDVQIMEGIAGRAALAIENARLYIQARRAAERERMVGEIAERLQRAPSLTLLLETAARELAEALGTDNVYAEISLDRPLARRRQPVADAREKAISAGDGEAARSKKKEARAEG